MVAMRAGRSIVSKPILRVAALGVTALLGIAGAALSQPAPTAQQLVPPSPSANGPAPYVLGMGDMMNTLVQPRHAKLGLAGRAENWALASYALTEIRQAFAGIAKAVPKFRGLPVGELVDAALGQPMTAVDAAIKQQDSQKFAAAYEQLTAGCNACHMELDHPYVVIRVPDGLAFPNQDFAPKR
jgi:hypothetical protein